MCCLSCDHVTWISPFPLISLCELDLSKETYHVIMEKLYEMHNSTLTLKIHLSFDILRVYLCNWLPSFGVKLNRQTMQSNSHWTDRFDWLQIRAYIMTNFLLFNIYEMWRPSVLILSSSNYCSFMNNFCAAFFSEYSVYSFSEILIVGNLNCVMLQDSEY